jgi:hypothetical protein
MAKDLLLFKIIHTQHAIKQHLQAFTMPVISKTAQNQSYSSTKILLDSPGVFRVIIPILFPMKKSLLFLAVSLITGSLFAQQNQGLPPALSAIKESEIKKDLFELASDAFRGRKAGTLDELRAAVWVAQKAKEAGLQPAGEDGTYFQFFNLKRSRTANTSTFKINNQPVDLWQGVFPTQHINSRFNGPVTWIQSMADSTTDIKGKIVALAIEAPKPLPAAGMSLWGYRYTASAIRQQSAALRNRGAAAIILVADKTVEASLAFTGHNFEEGTYQPEQASASANTIRMMEPIPILLLKSQYGAELKKPAAKVQGDFQVETFLYPSANVVAKAPGTDPKFKKEYVIFSGHHDHDGAGNAIDGDSIWNGADDNASVTVGMLAIARAWVAKPGKRSALFVWHGAEERGLYGSKWYAKNPTIPKASIVAVLNADMIGRNAPDSAALLGSTSHKNSSALVNMAMKANTSVSHFKVDFSWDDTQHPENWYFRSDHLPYAQEGIPAVFFTSLLHAEYHTPKDEAELIDIQKLTKISKWMYTTGWLVSETAIRPALETNQQIMR